MNLLTWWQ